MKILLFANTDWYLYNFRLALAERLRNDGWEVVLVSPPGPYGPRLQAAGFRWIPFTFSTRSTNPLRELVVIARLCALYRRERPDLAHHFTIKCVLYGSVAARFAGVKRIVNAVTGLGHLFMDPGLKARLLRRPVRWFYRLVLGNRQGRVVFQNASDRDTFIKFGLVSAQLSRLIRGSGVDCTLFSPPEETKVAGPVRVLFASRMLWEKGVGELLEAARILKERGLPVAFSLAGDLYPENPTSLTAADVAMIRSAGVVTWLGHVDDMPTLLANCDIVVLPSYHEGTPRILIEAAAMARPIVATDIPGCAGLVVDGVNGLLVPVRSVAPLADALARLIADGALRQRFGCAGREIVLREFDQSCVLDKTLEVYAELLESPGDYRSSDLCSDAASSDNPRN